MLILERTSLTPDPLYGKALTPDSDGWTRVNLYPVEVIRSSGLEPWPVTELDRWQAPRPLSIPGDGWMRAELLLDFGTEFEGALELTVDAPGGMNVYATFGESEPEAAGMGGYGQGNWAQVKHWPIAATGQWTHRFPATGFRFVRLQFHDLGRPAILKALRAEGFFTGSGQRGDFACEDRTWQRVWQCSAYTARACTRPDDFWDGIKRDRLGWYGDARITALTWAATFFDPRPVSSMLARMPIEQWVNGIPNFSFDAVAMLADQLLGYGLDVPRRDENWIRVQAFLEWVERTQTNADGFIIKGKRGAVNSDGILEGEDIGLQFGYGFLDWSALPVGGRLEELGWLQCKYLECLRHAQHIAQWLGESSRVEHYRAQADRLQERINSTFWQEGKGFHHTLRAVRPGFEKYGPGWAKDSYDPRVEGIPSGPSRHSTACAVFSGLAAPQRREVMLAEGFDKTGQPPVITPMFLYYEMEARARLGDPAGALEAMCDWLAAMILPNDAATVWESFEPEIRDFRKWGLHGFPKSLCHGWGSGIVPLAQRWLLGLENLAPGWTRVRLHKPALDVPVYATVPTPQGDIVFENGEVELPDGITVEGQ